MRYIRWTLLVATALAAVHANEDAMTSNSLMELEQFLVASSQLHEGRQLMSIDLFEAHVARYLMSVADTSNEVTTIFALYRKVNQMVVSTWGTTEAQQLAYFKYNVFPNIQTKAKELLLSSTSGNSETVNDEVENALTSSTTQTDTSDLTTLGSPTTSYSKLSSTKNDDGLKTSTNVGLHTGAGAGTGGGTARGGEVGTGGGTTAGGGMNTGGGAGTGAGAGTGTGGGTILGGGAGVAGGTTPGGGAGTGGGTARGGEVGTGGGTTAGGGINTGGGAGTGAGAGTGTGGGTILGGGAGVAEGTTPGGGAGTGGGTILGGGAGVAEGTTPGGGAGTGGGTILGGGAGTGGGTAISGDSLTVDGTFAVASTSSTTRTRSGTAFWFTTYNPRLAINVGSLPSQRSAVQTVVESSAPSEFMAANSFRSKYTSPTIIRDYSSPSRRHLSGVTTDLSDIDVLFCDIEGNAIWKWSAENMPDATVTNVSNFATEMDVMVDEVCSATTTLSVSAYQTGCSLQNHPKGCDDVYYKGCGGITVSPTSDRIVIARTGGRTLGVLNYKSVGNACQGQVVDAITTYRGKKFNSPTFVEYASNGILYFTDSPFGLATSDADFDGDILDKSPLREIPFNGVYMLRNGTGHSVELVDCEMTRPNKIAFSPSQDIMYITNSQKGNSYVKSYILAADGTVSNSSIFFNFTAHPELETDAGYARGIKVDANGYVYVVCYKGVYIFSPEADLAGAIMSSQELDSVSMGLGRLFISGSFGLVAQTSGVASQPLPRASVTCSA